MTSRVLVGREPGTDAPTDGTAGRVAALLGDRPCRHWRVRVTGQQPGQEPVREIILGKLGVDDTG